MKNVVTFAKALADETRWRIVRLVMDEALCVCELADILDMPQSTISSHVQIIRKAGMLENEKCGKWTYFRIESRSLRLLGEMEKFFQPEENAESRRDRKKAVARLRQREGSCCPGPVKLIGRKSSKTQKISQK